MIISVHYIKSDVIVRYTTQIMFHNGIPRRVRNSWTFHAGLGNIWQNKTKRFIQALYPKSKLHIKGFSRIPGTSKNPKIKNREAWLRPKVTKSAQMLGDN